MPYSFPLDLVMQFPTADKRLKVSSDRRFLVTEDSADFFWLADTAWELFHRLSKEETIYYLNTRAKQGFTVVQAVALAELNGLNVPNAEGHLPFTGMNPLQPNAQYFDHIDWVIQQAASLGIYIGLLPTWGDKVNKNYEWAFGPEIFNADNAHTYGKYIGTRFRDRANIVWILGGDRNPDEKGISIWRSMAKGIIEGVGEKEHTLFTFHPQPFDGGSSSKWFHHDEWLDFNMLQTGHDKHKDVYDLTIADYNLTPVKPVLDGEPLYEAHGLSFNHLANGYSSGTDVRKYAYWSLFSGACGYTYGCHSVWQFYSSKHEGVNFPIYHWKDALGLSGANQMQHLKKLITSKPLKDRIPDQSFLIDNQPKGEHYNVAFRCIDGSYAFVYTPTGSDIILDSTPLAGKEVVWSWFNPKNGILTVPISQERKDLLKFRPPNSGYGNDWVLVIESN